MHWRASFLVSLDFSNFGRGRLIENQTLVATRDALLPQPISGKLRVRDAEKAVEAVV